MSDDEILNPLLDSVNTKESESESEC
jgi:hypothetical protein